MKDEILRLANAALSRISNALDDLESSPDQRPVGQLVEARADVRAIRGMVALASADDLIALAAQHADARGGGVEVVDATTHQMGTAYVLGYIQAAYDYCPGEVNPPDRDSVIEDAKAALAQESFAPEPPTAAEQNIEQGATPDGAATSGRRATQSEETEHRTPNGTQGTDPATFSTTTDAGREDAVEYPDATGWAGPGHARLGDFCPSCPTYKSPRPKMVAFPVPGSGFSRLICEECGAGSYGLHYPPPDISEAVMQPGGVCPTCYQTLHVTPAGGEDGRDSLLLALKTARKMIAGYMDAEYLAMDKTAKVGLGQYLDAAIAAAERGAGSS